MKRYISNQGLTLVELLIGMAIIGVVLAALTSFFNQGTRISGQSSSRSELQQELLNAQQLITGKLREAWYIYPPNPTASYVLGSTPITQNPLTNGTNNWNPSATTPHPFLAMILPPRSPNLTCGSGTNVDGCYRFIAYYAMKRSTWLSAIGGDSWRNPGPDAANDNDTWVLAEYRKEMPASFNATTSTFPPTNPPTIPTNGQSNILTDYIAPTNVSGFTTSGNTYTMFGYTPPAPTGSSYVTGVKVSLVAIRQSSGAMMRIPNTGSLQLAVFPTNLGKTPSQ